MRLTTLRKTLLLRNVAKIIESDSNDGGDDQSKNHNFAKSQQIEKYFI